MFSSLTKKFIETITNSTNVITNVINNSKQIITDYFSTKSTPEVELDEVISDVSDDEPIEIEIYKNE
jgi:hypothetical protein